MRLPGAVWLMSIIAFCFAMGGNMIGPALPALARFYGVGAAVAGLSLSGFAAGRLLTNISLSRLLRLWRLRWVLGIGLLVQAVCSILAGIAPSFTWFIVFRSISGIGNAAFTVSSTAIMLQLVDSRQRPRAMSAYFGMNSMGMAVGPALGGIIAAVDPRLPLLLYGFLLLVGSFIAIFALRTSTRDLRTIEAPVKRVDGERHRSGIGRMLADRTFLALLLCQFAVGFVFYGMRTSTLPLYLGALGIATGTIGLLVTVGVIAQIGTSTTVGFVPRHIPRKNILAGALLVGVLSLAVFWRFDSIPAFVLGFALLGTAGGVLSSMAPTVLGDVEQGTSGSAVAIYWALFDVGAIIAPWLCGVLQDSVGISWAFVAGAVVLVVACAFVLRMRTVQHVDELPRPLVEVIASEVA